MCLQPQRAGTDARVDTRLSPPGGFITAAMNFAVMPWAKGNGELIANLPAESRRLSKSEMMRIGRMPAANQAWLLADRLHMIPVAYPAQHR